MKVYFFPPTSPFNPYIDNVVAGLETNGSEIVNKNCSNKYAKLLSSFSAMFKHTQIYHFNWIENNSAVDTKKNRLICASIFVWLRLMKIFGGNLVWTMHNKESHFSEGNKEFHYQFMEKLISRMDMILVHASETKQFLIEEYHYPEDQICFVPHGNYLPENKTEKPTQLIHDRLTILAFGMVNRYKNVPLLIRTFKGLELEDADLLIVGKCDSKDPQLKQNIMDELNGEDHIIYDDRFVPEEEVGGIFGKCDIVVLPYDKQSMINSGAAIMAFSNAKPIIVSRFGSIKDIEDREFVYCYDYNTEEEHIRELGEAIKQTYSKWNKNKKILSSEGLEAYNYAKNDLSWNNIGRNIVECYEKISRRK
ncbi:glycosyltransferase [Aerococcaceae bacterium DSM 109653]|uniref:Glycosyltransferase n=1 Tax=Fundicoccus ignavus TaxID=2664442 RepID=A0A844BWL4_9LACT|nr:glycosyltransferase [Fundicoccus ignavus]MRI80827.1 glycosyltransferase [Fundicoccus ignavus]